jgi:hypothetical protein
MTLAAKCDRHSPIIQDNWSLLTVDSQRQSSDINAPVNAYMGELSEAIDPLTGAYRK